MKYRLQPDKPKPLAAVRAGATSDARWRDVDRPRTYTGIVGEVATASDFCIDRVLALNCYRRSRAPRAR